MAKITPFVMLAVVLSWLGSALNIFVVGLTIIA